jgi:hypothetical protein
MGQVTQGVHLGGQRCHQINKSVVLRPFRPPDSPLPETLPETAPHVKTTFGAAGGFILGMER